MILSHVGGPIEKRGKDQAAAGVGDFLLPVVTGTVLCRRGAWVGRGVCKGGPAFLSVDG